MRAWMVVLTSLTVSCGEAPEKPVVIEIECMMGDGGVCPSSSTNVDETGTEAADDEPAAPRSKEPADDDVVDVSSNDSRHIECHPSKELGLGECEPLCTQTGCGSDQMCSLSHVSGQAVATCETLGHDREGETCEVGSCADGLACVQVDPASARCVRMCDVQDPSVTCDPRQQCLSLVSGTNLGVCIDSCDMTGGSCPPGEACTMRSNGTTTCVATEDRPVGATCSGAVVECTDGAHCIDDGTQRLCTQACFDHGDCRGACLANPGELGICRD